MSATVPSIRTPFMLETWACSWLICSTWLLISVMSFITCWIVWIRLAISITGMPCAWMVPALMARRAAAAMRQRSEQRGDMRSSL